MPSIYQVKPAFQNLLRPIVKSLAKLGVTANQVTITATLLSFVAGALILIGHTNQKIMFVVPAVIFLRMALNAIDGMLAREHNMKSKLGAFLNELGDVLSDAALYLPFAALTGVSASLIVSAVTLALISEMTGVVAVMVGNERRYDGPMGKSDRAFVFGVIALMWGIWGDPTHQIVNILLMIVICMLALTITNRVTNGLKEESR